MWTRFETFQVHCSVCPWFHGRYCSLDIILLLGGAAGAVDEESFISSFEDCKKVKSKFVLVWFWNINPKVTIFSGRGLEEELSKVHATLSTTGGSGDWKQRIEVVISCHTFQKAKVTFLISMCALAGSGDGPIIANRWCWSIWGAYQSGVISYIFNSVMMEYISSLQFVVGQNEQRVIF